MYENENLEPWLEKLKNANHIERINVALERDVPFIILFNFIRYDIMPEVVRAACLHPKLSDQKVKIGMERFPEIATEDFYKERERKKKLYELTSIDRLQEEKAKTIMAGDRDQIILNHILKKDSSMTHAAAHLGETTNKSTLKYNHKEIDWSETKKYRVAMVIAPAWGKLFPPYNLAKLTGLLRKLDYSTKVFDLNIQSFHYLYEQTQIDFWASNRYFYWNTNENFEKYILPYTKDLFDEILLDIVRGDPKVVGFSLYDTNIYASLYLIKELRFLLPYVCIVVGGPGAISNGHLLFNNINYKFVGESEEVFINFLENIPTTYEFGKTIGTTDSKLNLDVYPYPDYSDYNLNNYEHSQGVSIETSRGCVADCSFCAETHFWKFRSMTPERVVDEIKYQQEKLGVHRFWFVDSLVNGNLKNFQKLVDLILENNIKMSWNSYARCDGRMTLDFLKKVAQSGCTCLSYGVESGSQKVLHDMRKKIEIWEIENNLRDTKLTGIFVHVNWMLGFPTEEPIDCLHSIQLLANCRNFIDNISPGFGAAPPNSIAHLDTNWRDYNMGWHEKPYDNTLFNSWYTTPTQNTQLHRFLRIKFCHIWLHILKNHSTNEIVNAQEYAKINEFYTFTTEKNDAEQYIEQNHYVDLIRSKNNTFEASIVNEYMALSYSCWLYYGECKLTVKCDRTLDTENFGDFISREYDSEYIFEVDTVGNYSISLTHKFDHTTNNTTLMPVYERERNIHDYTFSNTFVEIGNINDWITLTKQSKETVHEQYRDKQKKVYQLNKVQV
jgi:radical SAM superfamily enzyme YgiQ (UPF0313 family)